MFSSHTQQQQKTKTTTTTKCSSLALCTFLAIAAAALDIGGAAASDGGGSDDGKLILRMSPYLGKDGHMIATRGNFLRFGKRSPEIPDEGGDDGDVNEVFDGPVRRDYREFVRFGKRGGGDVDGTVKQMSDKRGQDYLRFGKKADYLRFGKRADYLRFGKRDYDDEEDDDDFAKRRQLWKRFNRLQRANDFLRFG